MATCPVLRTTADYVGLAERGLPPAGPKARVLVIGAGMAGLVAARELARAGHDPLLIEARDRVGGRIETIRSPLAPGLCAEAGPMRIPRSHRLALHYAQGFGLPLAESAAWADEPFYRVSASPSGQARVTDDRDAATAISRKWQTTVAPLLAAAGSAVADGLPDLLPGLDGLSIGGFLEAHGWEAEEIGLYATVMNLRHLMDRAIGEVIREEVDRSYSDAVYIVGGMDRLPAAFVPELASRLRLRTRVLAIRQAADAVTVTCSGPEGLRQETADYAVVTLPLPVLLAVDTAGALSSGKRQALAAARYASATKVFLQCRSRFWQDEGLAGRGASTDLPLGRLYYPPSGTADGRGVLLASYSWGADADRWEALSDNERIARATRELARVHPEVEGAVEQGVSKVWHADPFARAAVAMFAPGRHAELQALIEAPDGRLHFAGEHASAIHGWIEGAARSGLRAALEVHRRAAGG